VSLCAPANERAQQQLDIAFPLGKSRGRGDVGPEGASRPSTLRSVHWRNVPIHFWRRVFHPDVGDDNPLRHTRGSRPPMLGSGAEVAV